MADHKERLISLRTELREAMDLKHNHEVWETVMTKLLNMAHQISRKASDEVKRIQSQLDHAIGTQETADMFSDLIINTISAHNNERRAHIAAAELRAKGDDGLSPGELEVQQREKEAEEKAQQDTMAKAEPPPPPPKRIIDENIKLKAVAKRRKTVGSNNSVRRRK